MKSQSGGVGGEMHRAGGLVVLGEPQHGAGEARLVDQIHEM